MWFIATVITISIACVVAMIWAFVSHRSRPDLGSVSTSWLSHHRSEQNR
jgi:hypothetical protein